MYKTKNQIEVMFNMSKLGNHQTRHADGAFHTAYPRTHVAHFYQFTKYCISVYVSRFNNSINSHKQTKNMNLF